MAKDKALLKLDRSLKSLFSADLAASDDSRIRAHVLNSVDSLDQELMPLKLDLLGFKIASVAKRVKLTTFEQARLKERVLEQIDNADIFEHAFGVNPNFKYLKTVLSSILLFFFVVTTIVVFPFQVPFTYAARSTYLEEVWGTVFVLRAGKLLVAKKNFNLKEGDVVVTKNNGLASVRFFDDSISRLDVNTQLELKRIYSEPFNPVATQVELNLDAGRVWSKVLNLVNNNSHFLVTTDRAAAIVSKKAAFDMQNNVHATSVSVYENVVDFSLKSNLHKQLTTIVRTKPVVAGFHAEILNADSIKIDQITVTTTTDPDQNDDIDNKWITSNLEKDMAHELAVVTEKEQILLDHQEDVNSPLVNPDLEKMRLSILAAYKKMLVGEAALLKGDDAGLDTVSDFKNTVAEVMKNLSVYEKDDPLNSGLLRTFISSKISQQRKDLATFLPGDKLYKVKEILEQSELLLAGNDLDRAQLQLSNAEDILITLQDLIQKNQYDKADELLALFTAKMDQIVLTVSIDDAGKVSQGFSVLLENQVDQLKVLTALQKNLPNMDSTDLSNKIAAVRNILVKKLMAVVVTYGDQLPNNIIQQLQGLLETYVNNEQKKDESYVVVLKNIALKQAIAEQDEVIINDVSTAIPTVIEQQSTVENGTDFVESKPL